MTTKPGTSPTSRAAFKKITVSSGNHRTEILEAFAKLGSMGGTAEEAFLLSGSLTTEPWVRCGELRDGGYIVPTGAERMASTGSLQMVCEITSLGITALGLAAIGKKHSVTVPRPLTTKERYELLSKAVIDLLALPVFDSHQKTWEPELHGPRVSCKVCDVLEMLAEV